MDEVRLKIRKRAVRSRGRARLNKSMLSELGAEEGAKLEIVNEALNKSVTVTLFADSMVEEGYIRLSPEDLESLGMAEEDTVIIRKKPPLPEQMREKAGAAAERVSERIERVGEAVKKEAEKAKAETLEAAGTIKGEVSRAYGRIVEETAPVTERMEGVTKETVSRIKEEVSPVTERVEGVTREVYARIVEELPSLRERFSKAAEPVINRLKPDQGAKLRKALEGSKGSIQTATISSDLAADKLIKELELPKEVVISAVQRNKEIVIPRGDTRLVKGDIVYLVGKEESLRHCVDILEG
jgi:K+/H+ antiporter YhaU regulatory subunit KhtT